MKLKDQVCSLELAKKLKTLGAKQESLWWWVKYVYGFGYHVKWFEASGEKVPKPQYILAENRSLPPKEYITDIYSAFTTSELGEMLPMYIEKEGITYDLVMLKSKGRENKNIVAYANDNKHTTLNALAKINEANARAKMLIYLIENKLVEMK